MMMRQFIYQNLLIECLISPGLSIISLWQYSVTILARGIEEENYQAVAASADILKDICVNQPAENDIWNLETALDWLRDHEPPEPESENSQDEGEGEGEDEQQQDETDDTGEEDSENPDDQQDNEPERDQEDSESDERDNENQDAEQDESNREEQLEDLLDDFQNREQEMTQEAARAILDMVTEADLADSTKGSRVLDISGQDW